MSVKWLSVADIHLRTTETLGKQTGGKMNTRTRDKLGLLQKTAEFGVAKKVDFVVLLGDVFDTFNPPERLRTWFLKALLPLIKVNIPIYWIIGNHETDMDSYNFMAMKSLLEFMDNKKPPIEIVNVLDSFVINETNFFLLPAMYTDEELVKILGTIENKENAIVFGHWATKEALIGEEEFRYHEGISSKNYKDFKRIYLGDFHKYQKYDNWMYVGSLAKKNFSERSDKKGFIYSTLSNTKELVDTFVVVPDRMFIEIEITETSNEFDFKNLENAVVKIVFKGTREWLMSLDRDAILDNLNAYKVLVDFKNTEKLMEQNKNISALTTIEDDVKSYCKNNNRSELIPRGLAILEGVK